MGLWSPYSYKLRHMSAGGRQWWELRNSFFSQRIREEKYTFSLWNRSQAATWRWVTLCPLASTEKYSMSCPFQGRPFMNLSQWVMWNLTKKERKPFGSKSRSCSFFTWVQRHWVKAERFSFAGNVTANPRLSTVLSASEAAAPCRFLPTPIGFVGTCSLWRGNDFHVHVFTLEFRVSFGRKINFLIPLGATWNSLKILSTCLSLGHLCNLLYLFVCTQSLINP